MTARSRPRSAVLVWGAICLVVALVATVIIGIVRNRDDALLTVNGWTLSRADFVDELQQIAANGPYLAARSRDGQPMQVFVPGSTTEFDDAFVVEFLNERVTFALAQAEVAKRSLTVTVEDRRHAVEEIEANLQSGSAVDLAGGSGPPGSAVVSAGVLGNFGSYRDVLIDGVAALQVLQRDLTSGMGDDDTALRALYDQIKDQYAEQACVRHILVNAGPPEADGAGNPVTPTEDEYNAALQRIVELKGQLDGGADFATLASQVSDDPSTKDKGGDLGCAPKGQYDQSFDDAAWSQPVGQVGAPVRSVYGYHLLLVTDRRVMTYDEVKDKLRSALDAQRQQALQDWVSGAAKSATVTIDRGVGTWNASSGVIEPPGGQAPLSLAPEQQPGSTAPPGTVAGVPRAGG